MSSRTQLGLEILGTAAAVGIAGDTLLRAMPWGLNAFLCTAALVAATTSLVRRRQMPVRADARWLALGALVLGSNYLARDSNTLRAYDAIGLAILGSLAALSLRGSALRGRDAWQYVGAGLHTAASACAGVLPLLGRDVQWSELPRDGALRQVRAAAVGVVLAFPLLVVFGALFASADPVFGQLLAKVVDVDFATLMGHMLLITGGTVLAAGYLRGALLSDAPTATGGTARGLPLGIVPVGTTLGLVNLLFAVFVVIQLRYFFGGVELVQRTTGMTYATYARHGFFELVSVSSLVLPLLLGADWVLRDAAPAHQRAFRALATLLLTLLAVVMASALARMRLYVHAFGLSEIRLYATAFMAYLAAVFAWFAWTALRGHSQRFAFGALVQGFAVLAGLHLLNPDAVIVRANLASPGTERPFDWRYAAALSADGIPALLAGLPSLDPSARCAAARGLLRRWTTLEADDWRNWNLSRARARRLLRANWARLHAIPCQEPTP
ncbi:MAG TPA: DUF4173 domain-containing protein [Gemmatimonadales bacterium]|nr:DUF4173 domain-containing protein [Gemmatimonadales bacterium]